jgi:hypothetical protein
MYSRNRTSFVHEFRPFHVFPTVLLFQNRNCLIFRSFACLHHLFPFVSPYTVSAQMQDSLHNAKDNTTQKKKKKAVSLAHHMHDSFQALLVRSITNHFRPVRLVDTACRPNAYVLASTSSVPSARLTFRCPTSC